MNKIRHFVDIQELSRKEIFEIFTLMGFLKEARYNGAVPKLLANKTLAMIFEEPSTRTRVSFEAAMTLLGGHAQYLKPGEIHLGVRESLYDTVKVLSHICDGIMCRALKHKTITNIVKYSDVPVLNGLSDYNHPTQAICDAFTMLEYIPKLKNKKYHEIDFSTIKVVFIGDRTNVCSSTMQIVTKLGMNFIHISPDKYKSPDEWIKMAQQNIKEAHSGSVKWTNDVDQIKGADIVYTDLWWWVDQEDEATERVKAFKPTYQVSPRLMQKAGRDALFMHCLPASRNVEVFDEVIDSKQSIVFEQAENRLTAQMGLLVYYLYPRIDESSKAVKIYHRGRIESFMKSINRSWKERYTYNNDSKNDNVQKK
ncbi:ornithine carbamoyltransferase [Mycoplasma sp. SG1]|uniref:ornithine carbamoyltransferase n=1 Tax=Mycoplasma sp. SG1 TaxID=2810348 RepID=UPI0020257240|nr:ornithine carbamoyltransferase [Mycoplasma sp. SG1]URM52744.1 ornithine carbamoyltransferase [Mycoplasma sp. SG1]